MRSTVLLLAVTFIVGGAVLYLTRSPNKEKTAYTLPSPHANDDETLFLTNIYAEDILGWKIQTAQSTLHVQNSRMPSKGFIARYSSQRPTAWQVTYHTHAAQANEPSPLAAPLYFYAAEAEVLANARNFLSLAYVREDTHDTSSLKELSLQGHEAISTALSTGALSIPSSPTTLYQLTYQARSNENNGSNGKAPAATRTLSWLEGAPQVPFRKLYFNGRAYWVREWYVLALARTPAMLYPKAFLALSIHTLVSIIKLDFPAYKQTSFASATKTEQIPLPRSLFPVATSFSLVKSAPYTWTLHPPQHVTSREHLVKEFSSLRPTIQHTAAKDASNNSNDSFVGDEMPVVLTRFIEAFLFLKADHALVALTPSERKNLKAKAKKTQTFLITSASLGKSSAQNIPSSFKWLTLYHHNEATYAETTANEPLYRLAEQTPLTLFHYTYDELNE